MKNFALLFIMCVMAAVMAACFPSASQVSPNPTVTPSPEIVSPSPEPVSAGTGSMKPFFEIYIYYDPVKYSVDQEKSGPSTIVLLSTEQSEIVHALSLYHRDISEENLTSEEMAELTIDAAISDGRIILSQAEEIEIGGEKWLTFSSETAINGQGVRFDAYVFCYGNGAYIIEFAAEESKYEDFKKAEDGFLQRITYRDPAMSQPPELSDETFTQTPSWQTTEAEFLYFSFEIPNTWAMSEEFSTDEAALFAPSGGDAQTSNIVIETRKTGNPAPSYSDVIRSDIFDIASAIAPNAIDMQIGDCYKAPIGYFFTATYQKIAPQGIVTQTLHIFLVDGYALIVYATDFGETQTPSFDKVVKHLIGTIHEK